MSKWNDRDRYHDSTYTVSEERTFMDYCKPTQVDEYDQH